MDNNALQFGRLNRVAQLFIRKWFYWWSKIRYLYLPLDLPTVVQISTASACKYKLNTPVL